MLVLECVLGLGIGLGLGLLIEVKAIVAVALGTRDPAIVESSVAKLRRKHTIETVAGAAESEEGVQIWKGA